MRRFSILLLPCVGVLLLAGLLFKTGLVSAAPATITTPGCHWQAVHSPNGKGGAGNQLKGMSALSANDVWAVGYSNNPGMVHTLAEHWDGKSWKIVPSIHPTAGNVFYGVAAVSTNDVWAVGDYNPNNSQSFATLIERWDGTQWSVVASPNMPGMSNILFAVTAVSANDVWAVGSYNNGSFTLIEHWDGTQWSIVSSANPGIINALYGITAISANDVWAVGYTSFLNKSDQTLTEHWNGTQWSVVSSPNIHGVSGNFLSSVSAVSSNDVWATGNTVYGQAPILHWDGTRWYLVPGRTFKQTGSFLNAVVAVSSKDVWAMGGLGVSGQLTLIEHWDGKHWGQVASPSPGSSFNEFFGATLVPGTTQVWTAGVTYGQTLTAFHC